MAQKYIARYLSDDRINILCKFKSQNLTFNKFIAFNMFLSHASSIVKYLNNPD